ncbi:unnamed protein product [Acanthosepion pharaonis]|uniref:Uncharacterized protein n=1 Tax=Acanthosepion pharaonis TaxID=158019 RepID=A0A812DTZ9_ACAPH|nr:unnamed protein product [Sepia pharaonis]
MFSSVTFAPSIFLCVIHFSTLSFLLNFSLSFAFNLSCSHFCSVSSFSCPFVICHCRISLSSLFSSLTLPSIFFLCLLHSVCLSFSTLSFLIKFSSVFLPSICPVSHFYALFSSLSFPLSLFAFNLSCLSSTLSFLISFPLFAFNLCHILPSLCPVSSVTFAFNLSLSHFPHFFLSHFCLFCPFCHFPLSLSVFTLSLSLSFPLSFCIQSVLYHFFFLRPLSSLSFPLSFAFISSLSSICPFSFSVSFLIKFFLFIQSVLYDIFYALCFPHFAISVLSFSVSFLIKFSPSTFCLHFPLSLLPYVCRIFLRSLSSLSFPLSLLPSIILFPLSLLPSISVALFCFPPFCLHLSLSHLFPRSLSFTSCHFLRSLSSLSFPLSFAFQSVLYLFLCHFCLNLSCRIFSLSFLIKFFPLSLSFSRSLSTFVFLFFPLSLFSICRIAFSLSFLIKFSSVTFLPSICPVSISLFPHSFSSVNLPSVCIAFLRSLSSLSFFLCHFCLQSVLYRISTLSLFPHFAFNILFFPLSHFCLQSVYLFRSLSSFSSFSLSLLPSICHRIFFSLSQSVLLPSICPFPLSLLHSICPLHFLSLSHFSISVTLPICLFAISVSFPHLSLPLSFCLHICPLPSLSLFLICELCHSVTLPHLSFFALSLLTFSHLSLLPSLSCHICPFASLVTFHLSLCHLCPFVLFTSVSLSICLSLCHFAPSVAISVTLSHLLSSLSFHLSHLSFSHLCHLFPLWTFAINLSLMPFSTLSSLCHFATSVTFAINLSLYHISTFSFIINFLCLCLHICPCLHFSVFLAISVPSLSHLCHFATSVTLHSVTLSHLHFLLPFLCPFAFTSVTFASLSSWLFSVSFAISPFSLLSLYFLSVLCQICHFRILRLFCYFIFLSIWILCQVCSPSVSFACHFYVAIITFPLSLFAFSLSCHLCNFASSSTSLSLSLLHSLSLHFSVSFIINIFHCDISSIVLYLTFSISVSFYFHLSFAISVCFPHHFTLLISVLSSIPLLCHPLSFDISNFTISSL